MIDISSIGIHPDAGNMDTGFIPMLEIWIRDSSQCWKYGYGIHLNAGNMDTGFIPMLEILIRDSSRCRIPEIVFSPHYP